MASFESGPVWSGRSANPASRGRRMRWLATAALAAPAFCAAPAFAQGQQAVGETALQDEAEIVVTAQKREESVRDVPQSLIVASGEELTSKGIQSLEDLAGQFPGVTTYSFGGAGQNQINIRGVTIGFDTASTVATYIDDVPFGSGSAYSGLSQIGLELGTFDVQRVELLRGPQGTLYGATAMGGLLKYVLNEADPGEFAATLQAEGTAHSRSEAYALRGALNTPIIADKLAIRVTGLHARDGGLVDNVATGEKTVDSWDKQVGRISLAFTPSDRLTLRATALVQNLDRDGSSEVYYSRVTGKPVHGDFTHSQPNDSFFRQKGQLYSLSGDYDLGFASLQATIGHQRLENDLLQDVSEAYPAILSAFFPIDAATVLTRLYLKKTTAEVRLASSGKQKLEYIAGLYYTDENIEKFQNLAGYFGGELLPIDIGTFRIPATYKEMAAYANATYHFTDRFDATFGLRVSRNDQDFEQFGSGLIGASNPGSSAKDTVVTYLGTVRYHLSDDNMLYARAANGYRPGGPNLVVSDPVTGLPLGAIAFEPDSLWNYEIGVKLRPARWLTADVSAFYIDWSNIQLGAIRNGIGVFANGGTARSQGIEFAFTARPTPKLTMSLLGAWIDAELTEDAPNVNGVDGERLPNTPRWSLSAAADYRIFQSDNISGSIGAGWKYLGKRTTGFDANPNFPQYVLPDFHSVDLRAGLEARHWTLDLFVRNLFDERGQLSASTGFAFAGGPARVNVIQPRTFGAILTTRF
ncbi:TonB-dependent receptor [Sphingosinicella rhizophila]|uniref:TonB-dependent receptor n=1 Tax=Sphingosinicella rhizophila TaxID=3050082 RepID=A0ABU3Q9I9_9SPHN|nr:TonB-dependent receptor [Sphingosinicella sp. GR2756]MDT9600071.1 TonB-dependent receptor [Sphingosinicella sp. GR2756]